MLLYVLVPESQRKPCSSISDFGIVFPFIPHSAYLYGTYESYGSYGKYIFYCLLSSIVPIPSLFPLAHSHLPTRDKRDSRNKRDAT